MILIETLLLVITTGLFGLVIGSFLNVCIYRIPREESIAFPASHCTTCGHPLSTLDLIPVFSYIFLHGKCRYCKSQISPRYMLVEVFHSLLYMIVVSYFGYSLETLIFCFLSSIMLILTMIDFEHMILPTKIIIFGAIIGVIFRIIQSILYKDYTILTNSILAAGIGYALFYTIFYVSKALLKKEGMGFGDIRYIAMIGIFLSPKLLIVTILLSAVIGSIYGIVQLYIVKTSKEYPYGPFISMATFISMLFGDEIINWYLSNFF